VWETPGSINESRGANQYSEITLYSLCSIVIIVMITNVFYNLANQMPKPIGPIGLGFGLFHRAQPLNPGGPAQPGPARPKGNYTSMHGRPLAIQMASATWLKTGAHEQGKPGRLACVVPHSRGLFKPSSVQPGRNEAGPRIGQGACGP